MYIVLVEMAENKLVIVGDTSEIARNHKKPQIVKPLLHVPAC